MKKTRIYITIAIALIAGAALFVACTREDSANKPFSKSETNPDDENECFWLGDQLENAYSVTNMQKAYDTLRANGMTDIVDVHCTHLYVKFYPETPDEYHKLISDTTLDLFDFPLDYEIIETGALCNKPGNYNELYTVVPVNYGFPNVRYDILEYCFIPDENATEAEEKVEMQSMILTGNLTPDDTVTTQPNPDNPDKRWFSWILPPKQHPSGNFTVRNTENGAKDPLVNTRVVTFRLVKIAHTNTNANGDYYMSKTFRWPCMYAISFRNSNSFTIWGNTTLAPAFYYMGRRNHRGYNTTIGSGSVAFPWATVNNAACKYIKDIVPYENVTRPPYDLRFWVLPQIGSFTGNAVMANQMKPMYAPIFTTLSTFNGTFTGKLFTASMYQILPDVVILKRDEDYFSNYSPSYRNPTKYYYSNTFHELSHTTHYSQVGFPYWQNYVNAIISNGGYGTDSLGWLGLNGYIGVGEMWGYFFENWNINNYLYNLPRDSTSPVSQYHKENLFDYNSTTNTKWFRPHILDSLCHRDGLDITPRKILNCMTVDVTTVWALKHRLKLNYGTYGRDIIIDSIFHGYGF